MRQWRDGCVVVLWNFCGSIVADAKLNKNLGMKNGNHDFESPKHLHRLDSTTVVRLTPDQKVGSSNLSRVSFDRIKTSQLDLAPGFEGA